ncbi:hypothetical protein FIV06_15775 [Labrenzia sp. THAF191b]|uniref:hypothetical protein n=1 Tax=unclassified Labrenzia TaxID=2648686 RepID=UPI0012679A61|nr:MULTISPECIES: hypothetical protein [unclassified Labrenzia]QFS98887.1 hypothetical protein FIV06_15775 [Labrenzia sp. THAF191b]QFT05201.1 hypothetical protein FIV05_15770 [Labrenzia sp. THAF191a]QFT16745.1 hypothetical protein FIV03_15785 [Labrenzia sp. THAF187b]
MIIDKAAIVNMALSEIGHFTTFTQDDDPDLADAVNQSWQRAIDRCVSLHDWKDFRRTRKLERLTEPPETGWAYAHSLPGDRIGEPLKILRRAGDSPDPLRSFDREGNLILCNETTVWARCKVELEPASWDAGWRDAFVTALAGYLAVPILQSMDLKVEKHREAFGTPSQEGSGGKFGRLMSQDRASSPLGSSIADAEPLSRAHGGDTGRCSGPWHGGF